MGVPVRPGGARWNVYWHPYSHGPWFVSSMVLHGPHMVPDGPCMVPDGPHMVCDSSHVVREDSQLPTWFHIVSTCIYMAPSWFSYGSSSSLFPHVPVWFPEWCCNIFLHGSTCFHIGKRFNTEPFPHSWRQTFPHRGVSTCTDSLSTCFPMVPACFHIVCTCMISRRFRFVSNRSHIVSWRFHIIPMRFHIVVRRSHIVSRYFHIVCKRLINFLKKVLFKKVTTKGKFNKTGIKKKQ